MTDLIKDIAGAKYRVERREDGCYQIPLRADKGWIYQHGEKTLGVHLRDTSRPLQSCKAIIARVAKATIYVMGDSEAILLCPVSEAKKLLRACGAKTRRQMTDEERERLAEMGRENRFTPGVGETEKGKKSARGARGVW